MALLGGKAKEELLDSSSFFSKLKSFSSSLIFLSGEEERDRFCLTNGVSFFSKTEVLGEKNRLARVKRKPRNTPSLLGIVSLV